MCEEVTCKVDEWGLSKNVTDSGCAFEKRWNEKYVLKCSVCPAKGGTRNENAMMKNPVSQKSVSLFNVFSSGPIIIALLIHFNIITVASSLSI